MAKEAGGNHMQSEEEGRDHNRGTSTGGSAAQIVNVGHEEENRENLSPARKKKFRPVLPKRKKVFTRTRRGRKQQSTHSPFPVQHAYTSGTVPAAAAKFSMLSLLHSSLLTPCFFSFTPNPTLKSN